MSTFVLIHGGGGSGWDWHLVAADLRARGYDVVAPDLPSEDDSAGLEEYADLVVEEIGDRRGLVVVGHSFGGFTVPLIADRLPVDALVFVAGMIPRPGETPADWWANTGYVSGPGDDVFYHDVPAELAAEARRRERGQSETSTNRPWPLDAWPDVPTEVVICTEDRLFRPEFLRRVAAERLRVTPDEIAAGHYVTLSRPTELADLLETYAVRHSGGAS